jgi:hypothetical protein
VKIRSDLRTRGGIMGVQAGIQIDSCGSGGLSRTPYVHLSIAVNGLTALTTGAPNPTLSAK